MILTPRSMQLQDVARALEALAAAGITGGTDLLSREDAAAVASALAPQLRAVSATSSQAPAGRPTDSASVGGGPASSQQLIPSELSFVAAAAHRVRFRCKVRSEVDTHRWAAIGTDGEAVRADHRKYEPVVDAEEPGEAASATSSSSASSYGPTTSVAQPAGAVEPPLGMSPYTAALSLDKAVQRPYSEERAACAARLSGMSLQATVDTFIQLCLVFILEGPPKVSDPRVISHLLPPLLAATWPWLAGGPTRCLPAAVVEAARVLPASSPAGAAARSLMAAAEARRTLSARVFESLASAAANRFASVDAHAAARENMVANVAPGSSGTWQALFESESFAVASAAARAASMGPSELSRLSAAFGGAAAAALAPELRLALPAAANAAAGAAAAPQSVSAGVAAASRSDLTDTAVLEEPADGLADAAPGLFSLALQAAGGIFAPPRILDAAAPAAFLEAESADESAAAAAGGVSSSLPAHSLAPAESCESSASPDSTGSNGALAPAPSPLASWRSTLPGYRRISAAAASNTTASSLSLSPSSPSIASKPPVDAAAPKVLGQGDRRSVVLPSTSMPPRPAALQSLEQRAVTFLLTVGDAAAALSPITQPAQLPSILAVHALLPGLASEPRAAAGLTRTIGDIASRGLLDARGVAQASWALGGHIAAAAAAAAPQQQALLRLARGASASSGGSGSGSGSAADSSARNSTSEKLKALGYTGPAAGNSPSSLSAVAAASAASGPSLFAPVAVHFVDQADQDDVSGSSSATAAAGGDAMEGDSAARASARGSLTVGRSSASPSGATSGSLSRGSELDMAAADSLRRLLDAAAAQATDMPLTALLALLTGASWGNVVHEPLLAAAAERLAALADAANARAGSAAVAEQSPLLPLGPARSPFAALLQWTAATSSLTLHPPSSSAAADPAADLGARAGAGAGLSVSTANAGGPASSVPGLLSARVHPLWSRVLDSALRLGAVDFASNASDEALAASAAAALSGSRRAALAAAPLFAWPLGLRYSHSVVSATVALRHALAVASDTGASGTVPVVSSGGPAAGAPVVAAPVPLSSAGRYLRHLQTVLGAKAPSTALLDAVGVSPFSSSSSSSSSSGGGAGAVAAQVRLRVDALLRVPGETAPVALLHYPGTLPPDALSVGASGLAGPLASAAAAAAASSSLTSRHAMAVVAAADFRWRAAALTAAGYRVVAVDGASFLAAPSVSAKAECLRAAGLPLA